MHRVLNILSSAALLIAACPAPAADVYPAKTVRIVVAFAAGGSTDLLARNVAQRLSEAWKQSVIVDNRAGGGGVIGAEIVAKAPADGYLIGGVSLNFTVYPTLYRKIPFQVPGSFTQIGRAHV